MLAAEEAQSKWATSSIAFTQQVLPWPMLPYLLLCEWVVGHGLRDP